MSGDDDKDAGRSSRDVVAGAGDRDGGARVVDVRVGDIPPSIVKAICRIKLSLESVKKSQRNQHGGYNFASTDDIYAALTKKMGEVGLVLLSLEDGCEVKRLEGKDGKIVQWAHMTFSFVLATEDGTWTDPRARRTLYIQVTGPQTFQAAQSYAEKAYLRSLFKLPTGDMDLDAMPQADTEEAQVSLAGNSGRSRKSSSSAKKDGTDKLFNQIVADIRSALNPDHLRHLREDTYVDFWDTLPLRWAEIVNHEYEDKMSSFEAVL